MVQSPKLTIQVPGKLILSGEHAVVYGNPALATTVSTYIQVSLTPINAAQIILQWGDTGKNYIYTQEELMTTVANCDQSYLQFMNGHGKITAVLPHPHLLCEYVVGLALNKCNVNLTSGFKLTIQSGIPIGSGMGSSAAIILALLHIIFTHYQQTLEREDALTLGLQAENLQHGYSSGLDLTTILLGQALFWKNKIAYPRTLPHMPLYYANTGIPQSTTGMCVAQVRPHFDNLNLLDDFASTTLAIDSALQQVDNYSLRQAIQHNHQRLIQIGVVPKTIQHFISAIEKLGGAAKICGAGAVTGKTAGMVFIVPPTNNQMLDKMLHVCQGFDYTTSPLQAHHLGVTVSTEL